MTKSKKKIQVKIDWIVDETGKGGIELIMNLDDFESSGSSIRESMRNFKKKYLDAVEQTKKIEKSLNSKSKSKGTEVSTKQRWKACKFLADFNNKFENEFEIKNYKEAYSRDFNLPMRSIRTYLDFGTYFTEEEILDKIPYSTYAEFTFVIRALKRKKLLNAEKKRLLQLGKDGKLPKRDEYRKHLQNISR